MKIMWRATVLAFWAMGCGEASPAPGDASIDLPKGLDAADDESASPDGSADATDAADAADSAREFGHRADRPFECPATAQIADTFDWAEPRAPRAACTEADLAELRDIFASETVVNTDVSMRVSPACGECVITPTTAPEWGPLLSVDDADPPRLRANVAGCMLAAGAPARCGRAVNDYYLCSVAACDGCDPADSNRCRANPALWASAGPCRAQYTALNRACAFSVALEDLCDPVTTDLADRPMAVVRVMCAATGR